MLGILGPLDRPYSETLLEFAAEDGSTRSILVRVDGQVVMLPSDGDIDGMIDG